LKRSIVKYILIAMITVFVVFHITSVLAREKQGIIKPSNATGETQLDQNANTTKITHFPVLIDPRNPGSAVSGTLGVDIRFSKTDSPWIRYSLSATLWTWTVRKPGVYATQCLTGTVKSNVDIVIDFTGFEDLKTPPLLKGLHWDPKCSDKEIETYYAAALSNLTVDQVSWHRASEFNNPLNNLLIPQNPLIATSWNLWNKISVTNDISACNFKDQAFITFEVANSDMWIDPEIPERGNSITK